MEVEEEIETRIEILNRSLSITLIDPYQPLIHIIEIPAIYWQWAMSSGGALSRADGSLETVLASSDNRGGRIGLELSPIAESSGQCPMGGLLTLSIL